MQARIVPGDVSDDEEAVRALDELLDVVREERDKDIDDFNKLLEIQR